MSDRLLFSVAGARGIVGESIDADVVARLSLAFGSVLPDGPIAIGRDPRPSGESFMQAAIEALTSAGRDVIDLGVATTPTVELITERTDAVGGIIVTASHNPVEWNALKFIDERGIFISKDVGAELYAAYELDRPRSAGSGARGQVRPYPSAGDEHIDAILGLDVIDAEGIAGRRFRVVVDCINGAGSVVAPELLEKLGCEVVAMNCKPDGNFFRDPEPRPEHLEQLARRVSDEGAVIGFAADPDADRLALVDGDGRAVSEEYTLALAADYVLSQTSGTVVVNMSTSSLVDHVAARHGATVHRTAVGEAHVVARMLETGAVIGGEGNGGVIYPALHPGRDAPLGMALILQLLASRKLGLADHIRDYPPFHMTKAKVALGGEFSVARLSRLVESLAPDTIDTQDGVKARFTDGWFHLRVSNTEGVVRVISEAADEAGTSALERRARQVLDALWRNDG